MAKEKKSARRKASLTCDITMKRLRLITGITRNRYCSLIVCTAVERKFTSYPSLSRGRVQSACSKHSQREANSKMQVETLFSSEMRGDFCIEIYPRVQ